MRARAGMHAHAERKMPCRCPFDDELFRPLGGRRVAVGGRHHGKGEVTLGECDILIDHVAGGAVRDHPRQRGKAHAFIHCTPDESRVGAKLVPFLRMIEKGVQDQG